MAQQTLPFADPPPHLSRTECNVLIEEADEAFQQLFTAVRIARNGADGTHVGGVSGATSGAVMMCTTVRIFGTIEEVAELYVHPDSRFVLDFAQSHRVYELDSPTRDHPLRCTSIRWSRWASIATLVADRDFLYLEAMDEFTDKKTGYRGWARCTKSIEHRAVPPSQHPHGPLRGGLFVSGQIVRETGKFGVLELITLVHADIKNKVPSWIARAVLKARKKNMLSLNHVLKVRRRRVRENGSGGSSQSGDRAASEDSDASARGRVCKGCEDHVSRWSRTFKCRKCHEMICKNCAAMNYFDTDTQSVKNRICSDCTFAMYDEEDTVSSNGDYHPSEAAMASQRSRTHKKKEGEQATRTRTYSYLSVDSDATASNNTMVRAELPDVEDLSSTMRRLSLLNGPPGNIPMLESNTHQDQQQRQPRKNGATSSDGTRRRDDNQRTLHTLYSNNSDATSTSNDTSQRQDRERSTICDRRKLERASSQDSNQSHGSQNGTGSVVRPVASHRQRPYSRKSPARTPSAQPAPPPMLDLAYLQDFASSKDKS